MSAKTTQRHNPNLRKRHEDCDITSVRDEGSFFDDVVSNDARHRTRLHSYAYAGFTPVLGSQERRW